MSLSVLRMYHMPSLYCTINHVTCHPPTLLAIHQNTSSYIHVSITMSPSLKSAWLMYRNKHVHAYVHAYVHSQVQTHRNR